MIIFSPIVFIIVLSISKITIMDTFLSNCFLLPMGLGSAILMYVSAYDNGVFSPFTDNKNYHKEISSLLLISFLYFVVDFALMISNYKSKHKIYFVHHIIGLVSVPVVYFFCFGMIKFLLSYLMYELSTPFLNISITNYKNKITNCYTKFINLLFFLTYTIIRIIFGSYLLCETTSILYLMAPPYKYLIILPIVLQILIYYWYAKIISMVFFRKIKKEHIV